MNNFRLTDKELKALGNNLNRMFAAYSRGKYPFDKLTETEIPIVHQEMQLLFQIGHDIEEYFDDLERKAEDQMLMDNIELGME